MSTAALTRYTPEEYFALERTAAFKSELIDGRMVAMAPGGSIPHNHIGGNVYAGLLARFARRGCHVYFSDVRVRFRLGRDYTYPDVMALCGTPRYDDVDGDTLINPALVVEVLSPGTEAYVRGDKFVGYQAVESLREYVLISQDEVRVEVYQRHEGFWGLWVQTDLDAEIRFNSVSCRFPLREIYARTRFVPEDRERGRTGSR